MLVVRVRRCYSRDELLDPLGNAMTLVARSRHLVLLPSVACRSDLLIQKGRQVVNTAYLPTE